MHLKSLKILRLTAADGARRTILAIIFLSAPGASPLLTHDGRCRYSASTATNKLPETEYDKRRLTRRYGGARNIPYSLPFYPSGIIVRPQGSRSGCVAKQAFTGQDTTITPPFPLSFELHLSATLLKSAAKHVDCVASNFGWFGWDQ